MDLFTALLLGLVQGFCEFLPVSSSGHIALLSRISGQTSSLAFSLVLHLATALAVIVFYRAKLWQIVKKPFCPTTLNLILATAVSGVVAILLKPFAESLFDGYSLAPFFLVTATLLTVSHFFCAKNTGKITPLNSLVIGIGQGLAVFPGLSRSATTVSTARFLGVDKDESVDFCFLLSLPIIIGSALVELIGSPIAVFDFPALIVGFISALVSGLISLKFIKSAFGDKSVYFIVYLVVLSVVITLNDCIFHIF